MSDNSRVNSSAVGDNAIMRPMSSSQKICHWGKYAIGLVLSAMLFALYMELSPTLPLARTVVNEMTSSISNAHRNSTVPALLLKHLHDADCNYLDNIKNDVAKAKVAIWNDWNVSYYPYFLNIMNIPTRSWDVQKAKFIKMLLDVRADNETIKDFVVGFSGSSVTAGHDNLFQDAYPSAFHRRLAPLFASLHMKLEVRNMAIGNNPCYPYDACISTHLGDDLDILTWEQSMNCGRNCKPLDTFTRSAHYMPKKPSVVYFLSGGPTWTLSDCIKMNLTDDDVLLHRPPLARAEKVIRRQNLRRIVRNTNHMSEMMFLKELSDNSDDHAIYSQYAAYAPMGVSTNPIAPYKCYGPYNYSFAEQSAHSHVYIKYANGSIEARPVNPFSSAGAPWHPGKRAHQLRADALAYYLLSILADSIDGMRRITCPTTVQPSSTDFNSTLDDKGAFDMNYNNNENIQEEYKRSKRRRNSIVGSWNDLKALYNNTERRSLSTTSSHYIYPFATKDIEHSLNLTALPLDTMAIEQYVKYVLSHSSLSKNSINLFYRTVLLYEYIAEYLHVNYRPSLPAVPESYDLPETYFPSHCYTDYEPRMQNSLESLVIHNLSTWQRNLSHFDVKGVQKALDNHWGYLDRKYVYYSTGVNSSIYLDIEVYHPSKIWLCELQKGFLKYPDYMIDFDKGVGVTLHPKPFKRGENSVLVDIQLELLLDQCYRSSAEISPGKYILKLRQKTEKIVNLAYLVNW